MQTWVTFVWKMRWWTRQENEYHGAIWIVWPLPSVFLRFGLGPGWLVYLRGYKLGDLWFLNVQTSWAFGVFVTVVVVIPYPRWWRHASENKVFRGDWWSLHMANMTQNSESFNNVAIDPVIQIWRHWRAILIVSIYRCHNTQHTDTRFINSPSILRCLVCWAELGGLIDVPCCVWNLA